MHTFCLDLRPLSLEEIVELAVAAEKYQVVNLVTLCSAQIEKLVRPDTVWTTLDRLFTVDAIQVAVDSCSKVSKFSLKEKRKLKKIFIFHEVGGEPN
jgi:hypothetical protein